MKHRNLLAGAALAALLIEGAAASPVPMDTPVELGKVEVVCTGIGSGKDDPRWGTYPIRVEFSNGGAQYLSGAHIHLSDAAGRPVADFDCPGAWVLVKAPRAIYTVAATIGGSTKTASFQPPMGGQKRVVLQFNIPANH